MPEAGTGILLTLFPFLLIAPFVWWVCRLLRLRSRHRTEVIKTRLGETTAKAYEMHPATLRVFQLTDVSSRVDHVSLEVLVPALSDCSKMALTLTHAEARDLVALMERALVRTHPDVYDSNL
jgi:hypothetical protein